MHCIDPALWDGDTSVDVPAHMDWRNNFEGAFRPERWLSEETKPKYYYTFGVGKHMCAGIHLVYMVRVQQVCERGDPSKGSSTPLRDS